MNKRTIIACVVALLVTVIAIFFIFTSVNKISQPKETVAVAVAKQEIKTGTILQPDMYEYVPIPKDEVIPSYVQKEIVVIKNENGKSVETLSDMLKGKEATENIYKGEKIIKSRVSDISLQNNEGESEENDFTGLRKMTYTAQGVQNLAGQLKAGDYIDFWIRYKLTDDENNDTIVVVDKILSNVPVVKALDSNSQEIKSGNNEASTTIEVMLSQEQIQEFIKWRDLGKITLVKVPVGVNTDAEKEVTRVKMSMNDLIWDVLSMKGDKMNKNDIIKDKSKKADVENYRIPENSSEDN